MNGQSELKPLLDGLAQLEQANRVRWTKINAGVFSGLIAVLMFVFNAVNDRLAAVEIQTSASALILERTATRLDNLSERTDQHDRTIQRLQSLHFKD